MTKEHQRSWLRLTAAAPPKEAVVECVQGTAGCGQWNLSYVLLLYAVETQLNTLQGPCIETLKQASMTTAQY